MKKSQNSLKIFLLSLLVLSSSFVAPLYSFTNQDSHTITAAEAEFLSQQIDLIRYTPVEHKELKANNPALKEDAKLKDFWQKGYVKTWYGNELLENAEIILLGEEHYNEDCYKRMAALVNTLYKEGDVLLTEGFEHLQPLSSTYRNDIDFKHLNKNLEIVGWDNRELSTEQGNTLYKQAQLKNELLRDIDDGRLFEKNKKAIREIHNTHIRIDELTELRNAYILLTAKQIFKQTEKSAKPSKRKPTIFVRLGAAHITPKFLEVLNKEFKYVALVINTLSSSPSAEPLSDDYLEIQEQEMSEEEIETLTQQLAAADYHIRHEVLKSDNPMLERDRELKDLGQKGYVKTWYGNELLENAEIILLSEDHDDENCHKNIAAIINTFSQEGDIVLTKNVEYLEPLPDDSRDTTPFKYLNKRLKIGGWDDLSANIAQMDLDSQAARLSTELLKRFSEGLRKKDKKLSEELRNVITQTKKFIEMRTAFIPLTAKYYLNLERPSVFLKRKPTIFVLLDKDHLSPEFLDVLNGDFKYAALIVNNFQQLPNNDLYYYACHLGKSVIYSLVISAFVYKLKECVLGN